MMIRQATAADLAAITDIHRATTGEPDPVDRPAWFAAHAASDRYGVWVVIEHGQVQGYGAVSAYTLANQPTTAATISYAVAPAAQGRGWGGELLAFLVDWGTKMGFTHLMGQTVTANLASNHLLTQAGFVKWGQSPDLLPTPPRPTSISYYAKVLK